MNPEELESLAFDIFKTFARFEYALKAVGLHPNNGDAKADWSTYSESIPTIFINPANPEINSAVTYLRQNPPKKQIIENGALEWAVVAPNGRNDTDTLLLYVRRVRNNLFHGGKFNGHWFQPERSTELLRHSLTILSACLDASPDVRTAFQSDSG